ncbi:MAG: 3-hydroxyacyl-CoA dehydrogenase family protein [Candidatus Altiarchaeota archaeon]|nr:3-hydroxyacyl-CoA dehydrogenase family protein [Candidatus Altiarchaeota archaeon]
MASIYVGVVGTGIGAGVAQAFAESGFSVVLKSRKLSHATDAVERILKRNPSLSDSIVATDSWGGLKNCSLVVECVLEDFTCKVDTFKSLEGVLPDDVVLATNTSSLSIEKLSGVLRVPGRFLGLHFFNPPTKMELVEVVRGSKTKDETVEKALSYVEKLGKTPLVLFDSPCFTVNRMLVPYLNEAVILLEKEVASREDIDLAARLGLHHPMGPLALLDLIGLDVFVEIMKNLEVETGDLRYKPAKLAVDMVAAGKLGRKSGEGFYHYKK